MGQFARLFRSLQTAFPPSGTRRHEITELLESITPVTLVPAKAAQCDRFLGFQIESVPNATFVDSSIVSDELWTPYIAFTTFHNDPVARDIVISLLDGVQVYTLASSVVDPPNAPIGQNVFFPVRRLFWVPPGFALRVQAPNLAAGSVVSMRGVTAQLSLADTPPPLF